MRVRAKSVAAEYWALTLGSVSANGPDVVAECPIQRVDSDTHSAPASSVE
jgi:hypothetical protein